MIAGDEEREHSVVAEVTLPVYGRMEHVNKFLSRMERVLELNFGTEVEVVHANADEYDPNQMTLDLL